MERMYKKHYLSLSFSIIVTAFNALELTLQLIFLIIGVTIGIPNWTTEMILFISLLLFVFVFLPILSLTLFEAWRYWSFDEEGVINGWLLYKKRINYSEVEKITSKHFFVGSPRPMWQEKICFKNKKRMISIPKCDLSKDEIDFFKEKTGLPIIKIPFTGF